MSELSKINKDAISELNRIIRDLKNGGQAISMDWERKVMTYSDDGVINKFMPTGEYVIKFTWLSAHPETKEEK